MSTHAIPTRAIVTHPSPTGPLNWSMQPAHLRSPGPNELLVRMVATGICHTDIVVSHIPSATPKILGHEGAGIVERVGAGVKHVKAGDSVVISFDFCGNMSEAGEERNKNACYGCANETPSYCTKFLEKNTMSAPDVYALSSSDNDNDNDKAAGSFFGQSSFSSLALVAANSAVNVSDLVQSADELKLFAPFACGFQTGAGAVTELADPKEGDEIAVFGLGGVGMLAVMAAKMRGCRTIIGVDRVQSRLDVAREVGATHVINTTGFGNLEKELVEAVRGITGGSGTNFSVDTTGVLDIVKAGLEALQPMGTLVLVGVMHGLTLPVELGPFLGGGKSMRACIEGSALPTKYIPQLIEWYRAGKLPIEKLIKHYAADDFENALEEMHSGAVIKPVLLW